jgi:phosphohistidine phosphatase SixA
MPLPKLLLKPLKKQPPAFSHTGLTRRQTIAALSLATLGSGAIFNATASPAADIEALLRQGGCAVLLRHAATDPGVGDPPEFKLGQCSTQRNLSAAGQADSRRIGAWFASRQLKPRAVLTSAWCRCQHTADLAFGTHTDWPALNSTFNDRLQQTDQSAKVRQALLKIPARQFEVWVTHQVNISALTGEGPAMGEAFILNQQGKMLARTTFA